MAAAAVSWALLHRGIAGFRRLLHRDVAGFRRLLHRGIAGFSASTFGLWVVIWKPC